MNLNKRSRDLINRIKYVTVSTSSETGQPWASPVFFALDHKDRFYWGSYKNARHSKNIRQNKNVFLVLFDSTDPIGQGFGIYIKATCQEISDPEEVKYAQSLLQKRRVIPYWSLDAFLDGPIRLYRAVAVTVWNNGESSDSGFYIDTRDEIK